MFALWTPLLFTCIWGWSRPFFFIMTFTWILLTYNLSVDHFFWLFLFYLIRLFSLRDWLFALKLLLFLRKLFRLVQVMIILRFFFNWNGGVSILFLHMTDLLNIYRHTWYNKVSITSDGIIEASILLCHR